MPFAAGGLRRPISPIKAITTPIAPAPQDMVPTVCAVRVDELEFRECYDGLLRGEDGWLKRQAAGQRRQRLRGTPGPVQDDPRIAAAHHGPGDWQPLLRLDLADLAQNPIGEGTLFFLISNDKLAARDFSDVRAIYEQT